MINYLELTKEILATGEPVKDRTGVDTLSILGATLRWDLSKGFPAVTSKTLAWRAVIGELLWFLEGSTNVERLRDLTYGDTKTPQKSTIWDDNYNKQGKSLGYIDGNLGPVYGAQWRSWAGVDGEYIDQLQNLIDDIKESKRTGIASRRLLVNSWNVGELDNMALPPCHLLFQCHLRGNKLSLQWYQRSVDVFLGLPFNIASYATLLHILCKITGCEPGHLIFNGGDVHIYKNHIEACKEMTSRRIVKRVPKLSIKKPITSLDSLLELTPDDFVLENYAPLGVIKAPMAV